MEPISNIHSALPAKETSNIAGRAIAAFGGEMDQLLAAVSQGATSLSHLGQNIDVKA